MKKSIFILLYASLLVLFGCNENQKSSNVVTFEDANFEKIVRNAIKETIDAEFEGPITQEDLAQLGKYFSKANNKQHMDYFSITADVKSVAGIEYIDGLQHLFIYSSQVDLSAIRKLNSLLSATIIFSTVEDLTPLSKVNSLSFITSEFNVNQLEQFSNLISFFMASSEVSAQGVIKNLRHNADLKTLELQSSNGDLEGVEGLTAFPQLKNLNLDGNQIKDITPLSKFADLTKISLRENEIEEIAVLLELPKLEFVDLEDNYLNEESEEVIEKLDNKNIQVFY